MTVPGKKTKKIDVSEFKDLSLLKALSVRENLERYLPHIKEHTVVSDTWFLLKEFDKYFKQNPEKKELNFTAFQAWFASAHASFKPEKMAFYSAVLGNAGSAPDDEVGQLLQHFSRLDSAIKIRDAAEKFITGVNPDLSSSVQALLDDYTRSERVFTEGSSEEELFVSQDAGKLVEALIGKGTGFKWSLDLLNKSFGPFHLGDFGAIIARPNGGKTTLLVQECLNFLLQMPETEKCIIFNNEELGEKLSVYAYKNLLKQDLPWIAAHPAKATEEYYAKLGGRKFYVKDDSSLTTWKIEKILDRVKPKVIGFNLLGKVGGFNKDASDLERLTKLYRWGRDIGKRYKAIVLTTHQADASAEGERYMGQQQMFGSKTEVQGELDVILACGRSLDPASTGKRYLSSCKNKQPSSVGMDPLLREGPLGEVRFDGDTSSLFD